MPGLGDLFKSGSIGEQLLIWGVLNQIISASITPAITEIVQGENELFPLTPLSAEQAATAVLRQIMTNGEGQGEASKSGVDSERFALMQKLAASPPSLGLILAAYQRSKGNVGANGGDIEDIDRVLADLGIAEQYWGTVKALAVNIPTQEDVFNAWLEGQITEGEATQRLLATGLDPSWITPGYNSRGSAPTPVQALEMLNRGIISRNGTGPDSTSYEQAFLEGPWRNKWLSAFEALGVYVPPPRTVTALLRNGTITQAEALAYFEQSGLSPATAAQYVADASHHATAEARALTQAQIVSLYEDKLIDHTAAVNQLVALRYSATDANLLLSLADQKAAAASIKSAVTRLRELFLAGHNDAAASAAALHALGLPDAQTTQLVAVWQLEQVTASKSITASEIASAVFYQVITQEEGIARLVGLGYTPHDAWIVISVRMHGPQPNEPAA